MSRNEDAPLAVHIPAPGSDRPGWVKVGLIAAIGFAVGLVWPKLAGVKFGPTAPEPSPAARASAAAPAASARAHAPNIGPEPSAPISLTQPLPNAPEVKVSKGFTRSCKNQSGETLRSKQCGAPGAFDSFVEPRVSRLSQCAAAEGVSGKLSLVVHLDFGKNQVHVEPGKESTVGSSDGMIACIRQAFQGAPLASVPHDHSRYTLLYSATLTSAAGNKAPPSASDETLSIVWETGVVRSQARDGTVVARLPRGSRVKIGAPKDGWYPVRYGSDFASEGWIHRAAIGK